MLQVDASQEVCTTLTFFACMVMLCSVGLNKHVSSVCDAVKKNKHASTVCCGGCEV
jgi:hypothetical protein